MDILTGKAIKEIIGALHGQLPKEVYEKVAPLLSELVSLLERAHEEERRQLRAERSALDKEREAVTFARHSVDREREALAREREIIEREKRVAQRWREVQDALGGGSDAAAPEPPG
jgi:hypothetical protein